MSSLTQKTEHVMRILRELPPAKVNELIDFAEYLKSRTRKTAPRKPVKTGLPLFHLGAVNQNAFDRSSLYGERLDTGIA
jgi:urease beta subunit